MIYNFQCSKCKEVFEELLTIKQSEEFKTCPNCKTETLKKLISKPSFAFKGTGFYATDYKSLHI